MNRHPCTIVSLSKASAESVFFSRNNKYHVWSGCILGRCSCKVYLRDHIICISDSSQTSFIFCIQALEIHTSFWKYFYPLEGVQCVGLLALFVRLGIWWWLKSALLLEFMWYAVFSQIFIQTGLQEIGRAPQNNPNNKKPAWQFTNVSFFKYGFPSVTNETGLTFSFSLMRSIV